VGGAAKTRTGQVGRRMAARRRKEKVKWIYARKETKKGEGGVGSGVGEKFQKKNMQRRFAFDGRRRG